MIEGKQRRWCERKPSNETIAGDQRVRVRDELADAVGDSDAASGERAAHRTLIVGWGLGRAASEAERPPQPGAWHATWFVLVADELLFLSTCMYTTICCWVMATTRGYDGVGQRLIDAMELARVDALPTSEGHGHHNGRGMTITSDRNSNGDARIDVRFS
jgi:hypothetical protein